MRKRSGQILILVLLIVVVALAVGLSVASRNITNLRTSTQTEQSQRAFSTAEGGVEDVLSRLSQVANAISTNNYAGTSCSGTGSGQAICNVSIGTSTIQANVNINALPTYQQVLDEGTVGQINLDGAYAAGVRTINVDWSKTADAAENTDPKATIEISFVCQNPACFGDSAAPGQSFSQHREAYYCISNPSGQSGVSANPRVGTGGLNCGKTYNLSANDNLKIMRTRTFWNKATVQVASPDPGFPVQRYDLTSTATTPLGITRKVQVSRTALPQLPASFDYVLYSEGDIVK